ncbi:hypothetical protein ACWF86_41525, partial [Streptomyces niveus]
MNTAVFRSTPDSSGVADDAGKASDRTGPDATSSAGPASGSAEPRADLAPSAVGAASGSAEPDGASADRVAESGRVGGVDSEGGFARANVGAVVDSSSGFGFDPEDPSEAVTGVS